MTKTRSREEHEMEFIQDFQLILEERGKRELIAHKMGRSTRTIERWATGETNPSPAEVEKLRRIINGMCRRALPVLSSTKGVRVK